MTLPEFFRRLKYRLNGRVVHLRPSGAVRGYVLVSYTTLPFLNTDPSILDAHSNRWECKEIVRQFLERSYAVDVIDTSNTAFVPENTYDYLIDNGKNMEHLAPLIGKDCIKVFHISECHWKFNNEQEMKRIEALKKRRGIVLAPARLAKENRAIELCDTATILAGTDSTAKTYAFAHKPMHPIPISTTHEYPYPGRNLNLARKNFIWFGGAGAIHKGLDLVLEAFAAMPEYMLVVCGKIEQDFADAYKKELYETKNIKTLGWTDPGSESFKVLANNSIGIILTSCAEGCAGSVIVGMHAALVPIINREAGVETGDYGILLQESSVEEITRAVREIAAEPEEIIARRTRGAWEFARMHHTRKTFAESYASFLDMLLTKRA